MNPTKPTVLVVDDDAAHRSMLREILGDLGMHVECAASGAQALNYLEQRSPDLMILDMRMPILDGLGTLAAMRERGLAVPTLVLTAHADLDDAVRAMKLGALDYLRKPIDIASLQLLLDAHLQRGRARSRRDIPDLPDGIVMGSPLMLDVLEDLARVASSRAPLLLSGETGTGKDVLAELLHRWSERSAGPFVPVNLAALPETLTESELFGHCKGAFTGADRARTGRFEEAHGGTLFLDEIGEMPLSTQPKILRALQDGRVTRLGESEERTVDFRLVAATNRDLEVDVAEGAFRQDLYYRIAVVTIEIPPLRERGDDVLGLARSFLERGADGRKRLSPSAEARLLAYSWPGNIRELQSAMLRASILAAGDVVMPENLPPNVRAAGSPAAGSAGGEHSLAQLEREAIEEALARSGNNRTDAARELGISRRKLLYRLKQYREADGAS